MLSCHFSWHIRLACRRINISSRSTQPVDLFYFLLIFIRINLCLSHVFIYIYLSIIYLYIYKTHHMSIYIYQVKPFPLTPLQPQLLQFIIFVVVLFLKNFYWSIVDLQCCVSFCCKAKWISYTYIYLYPLFS